jgi:death-on-curing protein
VIYLDEEDLIDIATQVLEGQQVVIRDLGPLSMSAHRPQTTVFGYEPYGTIAEKAAALLVALIMNRAVQDGNQRLALAAAWAFCGLNCGRQPSMTNDQAYDLVMGVATGDLDVPDVAAALSTAGIP